MRSEERWSSIGERGPHCTEQCSAMPVCGTCGRRKKPVGRDSRDSGLCDGDCPGYEDEPRSGHLWPEEGGQSASDQV